MFGIFFPFKLLIPPRRRRALVPVTSVLGQGHRHRHSRGAKGSLPHLQFGRHNNAGGEVKTLAAR